jgi:hypothetical protein
VKKKTEKCRFERKKTVFLHIVRLSITALSNLPLLHPAGRAREVNTDFIYLTPIMLERFGKESGGQVFE